MHAFPMITAIILLVFSYCRALHSSDAREVELCGAVKQWLMAVISALNQHLPS